MKDSVLKYFILLRLILVPVVQTWFVPDETWQATEVAHYWKYGYGYLCWEWQNGIRSIFYPGLFVVLFHIFSMLKIDFTLVLIHGPRIMSAIIFAFGDYYIFRVAVILFGRASSGWVAVCLSSSWFLAYCCPRTLSSCAEMTVFAIALYNYPWHSEKVQMDCQYLWWVGIGCLIRPTLGMVFLPLYMRHFLHSQQRVKLFLNSIIKIFVVITLSFILDSSFYGRPTVVPWNFIYFNIVKGMSLHYGTHPWHWYFTQGLPVICGIHLIPAMYGIGLQVSKYKNLLIPCLWSIIVHSCLEHKEFRFILPVLPLLLCIAGDSIHCYVERYSKLSSKGSNSFRKVLVLLLLIIPNVIALFYMGCIHQRGPFDVINQLRHFVGIHPSPSILFLTPCHSTPLYSHLHHNVPVRFLTCEPNVRGIPNYVDEADDFFKSPLSWMQTEFARTDQSSEMASHIVMYDSLDKELQELLITKGYNLCSRVFNSHFYEERRGKYFLIYCRD